MERILFKIVLIGITAAAGKSAFVFRIISGKFSKDIKITIGAEFFTKKLTLDNIEIVLYIWDVAGAHRGRFGLPLYCKGARGAIIMFDLTREKESIRIKKCLKFFRENAVKDAPFIIVGNKLDLIDSTYNLKERKEIQLIAQELNSPYFEISVKTGYNFKAAFNTITNLMLEQIPEENIQKKLPFDFTNQLKEDIPSILENKLLDHFSLKEKKRLLQHNVPAILMYIEKVSMDYPNMFPCIFKERLFDYLNPEQKTRLMQLNYPLILKWIQKMSRSGNYLEIKDILLDYLNSEEIKQIIQSSFTIILNDIEKIGKHFPNLFLYFFEERLLHYLNRVDQKQLIQRNYPVILNYIQKTPKHYPEKFFYIVNTRILDYLLPEIKSQLIQQNYLIFFKNLHKIMDHKYWDRGAHLLELPKSLVVIFEERLFDYLSPEEKKQFIQQNFPLLFIYIKRITRNFGSDLFMRKSKSKKISEKTLSYMYLTVIDAINGTKLMDDFLKGFAEEFSFSDGVFNAIDKAIHSIKENQELKQRFTAFGNTWRAKREEIKRNQELKFNPVYCYKCSIPLTPKSMDTLIMKGQVYCTYCGILNRRKYSFEAQSVYLEAKKANKPIDVGIGPFIFRTNYERIRCPMCSALGFDLKKISKYAKICVCKKCGYKW